MQAVHNERRIEMRPLLSSPNGLLVATESQESIRLTSPVNGSEAGFLNAAKIRYLESGDKPETLEGSIVLRRLPLWLGKPSMQLL